MDARKVFDGAVSMRDLVARNSMLAAYMVHEIEELGFQLFLDTQKLGFEPDIYTYTSVLGACFEKAHKSHGQSLHALVIKRRLEYSVPISNALIAMYLMSNNTCMREAFKLFESMVTKDRLSWNSILTGFSQTGLSKDALKLFGQMKSVMVEIDHYAFSAALISCADLARLQLGQQVHVLAIKSGFETNEFVATALIFMYSRCGVIEDVQKSFEETPKDSSIAWNSIIFGYAQNALIKYRNK